MKLTLLFVLIFMLLYFTQTISFNSLYDNFEQFPINNWDKGQDYGQWYDNFNGYGSVSIFSYTTHFEDSEKSHYQLPQSFDSSRETYACFVAPKMEFNIFPSLYKWKLLN